MSLRIGKRKQKTLKAVGETIFMVAYLAAWAVSITIVVNHYLGV
jgi:hypothetical protein